LLLATLLGLSFASGAAALIYEVVWFQLLELALGSTAVSLGVMLATFMGGLCAGSLIFPRLSFARKNPLLAYAALEAGIGGFGVLALLLIPHVGGALAAACLLPPTMLMGATLPALARSANSPREVGFLYSANIGGGVLGCLLAGFYLLRVHDVSFATYAAVAINLVAALWASIASGGSTNQPESEERGLRAGARGSILPYVVIATSGFCALAAESIWTRLLGLLLGASVYTLSIVLAVFLVGLGMGSGIGSQLSRSARNPLRALGWSQLLLGGAIAWTAYSLSASLPFWPVNPSLSTGIGFNIQLDLARAFWALLPPTILWGASFPLALAASAPQRPNSADLVSSIYAANTLGAIAGALCASLLLVATLGSQGSQRVLAAISVAGGLLLLRDRWIAIALTVPLAAAALYSVPSIPKILIAHGRYAATWVGKGDVIYAGEGRDSSVAVMRFADGALTFHVAGKIQASTVPRDMRLQRMLGHLTTLASPQPRSVLVIGCGAGITAGAVSVDPRVKTETIVEIERLVPPAASTYFRQQNFDVLTNPKVRLRIADGRQFLLTTSEKYDGITIDPLDPWVKGAANLYTKEFHEAMKEHLNPGGVVTMYIQLFETNLDAVKSLLATFFEVFPNGTVWGNTYQRKGHDMVLMGQVEPLRIDLDELEQRLRGSEYAKLNDSLAEVGMNSSVDLFATYAGRGSDLKEWLKDAPINRDRNLRMQYLAGLGMDLDDSAAIYSRLLAYRHFPQDIFLSAEGRDRSVRLLIERAGR
jgi:spermidine synthase